MAERKGVGREDIPLERCWNAESLFAGQEQWEYEYQSLEQGLEDIAALEGTLAQSPQTLFDAFEMIQEYVQRLGRLTTYASMSHSVNARDQAAAEMYSRAQGLSAKAMSALAFIDPELLGIGPDLLNEWMEAHPDLAYLKHYCDDLFRKQDHIRSEEVEQILGLASDPFNAVSMTYGMLTDADMTFPPAEDSEGKHHPVNQGTFQRLLSDPDRSLRASAWKSYLGQYRTHRNTLTANLAASIKQCVFESRVRRYPDSLAAVLGADRIPTAVYHNLIETFKKHLPLWHRYWRVRRKFLGLDRLQPYDTWAPLTESQPIIPYQQAVEWILEGLAPMGDGYVGIVRKGCFDDRWVDVYPTEGKQAGAFSSGSHGTHPFICMSYNDTILSLSTLAHELGHSMHSFLTWQNQRVLYGEYSLFVAEVASNFHQALVRAHLMEHADPSLRISILEEAMSNFHRYFFIMPTLARLELELHQREEAGQGLTADWMSKRMVELLEEGYGGEVEYDPDLLGILWAHFGHLYEDYYVYQYATGISGAQALAARVLGGEQGAVESYLEFLRAGSSLYPLDALKVAGVDLTDSAPVEAAFHSLENIISQLEDYHR